MGLTSGLVFLPLATPVGAESVGAFSATTDYLLTVTASSRAISGGCIYGASGPDGRTAAPVRL